MTSAELRSLFLSFFEERGHMTVASSPLIPANDPTLLFTNAGMVQFKDVFLGREERPYVRAASSQRCVRAGGKHNDLENVGYTARHHTFFEMLGNFSFGDYFKREAIHYAWEFLTGVLGVPASRLWVTVYDQDTEAADIWLNEVGVDPARFSRIGTKDNFWSMGDTGPCGPCTEIFFDHGESIPGGPPGSPDEEGDRYIEIWNLVFMQYDRSADGTLTPLPRPSVDTGMGLERIAAVVQGVHSNYATDLFQPLLQAAARLAGLESTEHSSLRVLADHIRSCSFLIADGVLPSNEGRGYVLRRIIRRAIRHGYKLGIREVFFFRLVDPLCAVMGDAYPDLRAVRLTVEQVLRKEEERFSLTIERGMSKLLDVLEKRMLGLSAARYISNNIWSDFIYDGLYLDDEDWQFVERQPEGLSVIRKMKVIRLTPDTQHEVSNITQRFAGEGLDDWIVLVVDPKMVGREARVEPNNLITIGEAALHSYRVLDGHLAFVLYDTYGFPLDLTQDVCREHGVVVDVESFNELMNKQRNMARSASHFAADYSLDIQVDTPCEFTGYEHVKGETSIVGLYRDGRPVDRLGPGESGSIILRATPFYGESGGQAGDRGLIRAGDAVFEVADTQKQGPDVILHQGQVTSGEFVVDGVVTVAVDADNRLATALNHSATHLLHAALRGLLGEHVTQKGSLVNGQRLRFDFSHFEPLSVGQLEAVERLVNEQIRLNSPILADVMAKEEALKVGAMALFGEKYGDQVRVLRIGDFSTELCGGTHAQRAGDIGFFKIVSESGVASGVRRIEAITGAAAFDWVKLNEGLVARLAERVKGARDNLEEKLDQLIERNKALEKELGRLKGKLASASGDDLASRAIDIGGLKFLAARIDESDAKTLRELADQLRNKLGSSAVVLGGVAEGKVSLIAAVSKDQVGRIKAGDLVNVVAVQVGGKGGGRPDMAQAGGTDPSRLDAALKAVPDWVRQHIA